jgi:hypothetical protein
MIHSTAVFPGATMAEGFRARLAAEAAAWRHAGLIDDGLAATLAQRFAPGPGGGRALLRGLGMFALFLLASSVLSAVGYLLRGASPSFAAVMVLALGAATWYPGARLAADPLRRHAVTGSVLVTFGLVAAYAGFSLLYLASGGHRYGDAVTALMLLTALAAFATAYGFGLRWPLTLALLLLFHAVGSRHGYVGHGAYFIDIQDERSMAVVALAAAGFGLWHEDVGETGPLRRQVGFGHLWIVFGLLYFNLCVWILSLFPGGLAWVLTFTAAGIGQIVAGAWLKDARFTGFGIVFLAIDLYTRLFEHFWDRLSAGTFLVVAGVAGVLLGTLFERRAAGEGA